jgi:hypothetical protein
MSACQWPLPDNLQSAVDQGALSMWEASCLEDCDLMTLEELVVVPMELHEAVMRLYLLEAEVPALMH